MKQILKPSCEAIQSAHGMDAFIKDKIVSGHLEDAFYVLDVSVVEKLWEMWHSLLPRVKPFYAVKCNPSPQLVSLLGHLGAGFDVASMSELALVLNLGFQPKDIIFANPCKLPSHISFAGSQDVNLTTFDCEGELIKLKKHHPRGHVLLRLRVDDQSAKVPLGAKFGAELGECSMLLKKAKDMQIGVAGVSFHVGTGASDAKTFTYAIKRAKKVFNLAAALGLPAFSILDIGGGFVSEGGNGVKFATAAMEINTALEEHFPSEMNVTCIAEPGRYFAEEPFTLVTNVFGCRFRTREGTKTADYWINDGIYGSMNCLVFDYAVLPTPRVIAISSADPFSGFSADSSSSSESSDNEGASELQSTIFGPTCDSIDTVLKNIRLPELEQGDWLVFSRMGAYTVCAASSFNGFSIDNITTFSLRSA